MSRTGSYNGRDRIKQLTEFQAAARSMDLAIDDNFRTLLREAQGLLELSDQEIGDAISVSRPTVNRWINGKNLPYNALRKPVLNWIDAQITKKVKILENMVRSVSASSAVGERMTYPMAAKRR